MLVVIVPICTTSAGEQRPAVILSSHLDLLDAESASVPADSTASTSVGADNPAAKPKPRQPTKGTALHQSDFSYLEDPNNIEPYQPFDELKRVRLGEHIRFDLGGEYRNRIHVEDNMRLKDEYNDFDLNRTRLYLDLWYSKSLRFYAEFLDAVSFGEEAAPRSTDEDRSDLLNLFTDIRLSESCGGPLFLRIGRQELLYGSERLVSSPDWSNVRRTYEGAKFFWKSGDWDVDVFWVEPVIPVDPHNLDSLDEQRKFFGLFTTWHTKNDQSIDLYYLRLDEHDANNGFVAAVTGNPGDFDTNTLGSRWTGKRCDWLWELEGAFQFGKFDGDDQRAAMVTAGLGHDFKCLPTTPTVWAFYDFASGDSDPTDNHRGTFNQLFPSGHRYLGWQDLIGRQNIHDVNFQLTAKPTDRLEFVIWCHIFRLDSARDNLYNAAGRQIRATDPSGSDGTDVGQELDMTLSLRITPRVQWLLGYSHLFAGSFIANSAAANNGSSADVDFVYSQVGVRF